MAGDYCWTDAIQRYLYMDDYVRIRTWTTIYIWPLALLDSIQSSFSISILLTLILASLSSDALVPESVTKGLFHVSIQASQ